jgi:hypothetical protein
MVSVSLLFFVQIKKYMIKKNGFVGIGRLFGASVYRDISFESRGSGNFFLVLQVEHARQGDTSTGIKINVS